MTEQAKDHPCAVRKKYAALARKEASGCGCSCAPDEQADSLDMIGDGVFGAVEGV